MQSKKDSLMESLSNTIVGLCIATLMNRLILPLFGYMVNIEDSFGMACVFTVISVVRNYIIRRYWCKR